MHFPRPCRFVARRFILACEFAVGKALAADLGHGEIETLAVVHVFPVVKAEGLLVYITEQVERFHADVGSMQSAFEAAPEILDSLSMYRAVHIPLKVINDFMRVTIGESVRIRVVLVCVDDGTGVQLLHQPRCGVLPSCGRK